MKESRIDLSSNSNFIILEYGIFLNMLWVVRITVMREEPCFLSQKHLLNPKERFIKYMIVWEFQKEVVVS